ncbi:unnamed protein product [Lampetra fluviatilis]
MRALLRTPAAANRLYASADARNGRNADGYRETAINRAALARSVPGVVHNSSGGSPPVVRARAHERASGVCLGAVRGALQPGTRGAAAAVAAAAAAAVFARLYHAPHANNK